MLIVSRLFGIWVADIGAAIELANGTEFGLGANAWTNYDAERSRFIRDLAAYAAVLLALAAWRLRHVLSA